MSISVSDSVVKKPSVTKQGPFTALDLVTLHSIDEVEANPAGSKLIYNKRSYNADTNSTSKTTFMLDITTGDTKDLTKLDPDNSRFKYQWVDDQRIGFTTYAQGKLAFWVMDDEKYEPVKHFECETIKPSDSRFSSSNNVFTFVANVPTREKNTKSFDSALFYDTFPMGDYKASKVRTYHYPVKSFEGTKGAAYDGKKKDDLQKGAAGFSMEAIIDDLGLYDSAKDQESISGDGIPHTPPNITQLSRLDPDSPISCISPDRKKHVVVRRANFENLFSKSLIILTDIETKKQTILNESWDLSPLEVSFSKDGTGIFVTAEELGQISIFLLDLDTLVPQNITDNGSFTLVGSFKGERIIVSKSSISQPIEFLELTPSKDGKIWVEKKISNFNKDPEKFNFKPYEPFYFKGANQDKVHGFMVKPPDFNSSEKYPLLVYIRGGPNTGSNDFWREYANHQVMANAGFIVVEINYHGSLGFGDDFAQSIVKRWGDTAHKDIILGTKYLIEQHKFIDKEKVAVWGHSFGGYLANYLNGHNEDNLFKVFMVYAGVFDIQSSFYTTDLPYFFSYQYGALPFESINASSNLNESLYHKFSPSTYVANWKTPAIVVHGKGDLRVKDSESMATYSALKVRKIPAKFLYFQDEEHIIEKPANLIRFYNEGLKFTAEYLNHNLPYAIPSFYDNLPEN